jgi:hypothetical protein
MRKLSVDWKLILIRILKKETGGRGLDSSGSGYGSVTGSCEHSTKLSGFVKSREFIE